MTWSPWWWDSSHILSAGFFHEVGGHHDRCWWQAWWDGHDIKLCIAVSLGCYPSHPGPIWTCLTLLFGFIQPIVYRPHWYVSPAFKFLRFGLQSNSSIEFLMGAKSTSAPILVRCLHAQPLVCAPDEGMPICYYHSWLIAYHHHQHPLFVTAIVVVTHVSPLVVVTCVLLPPLSSPVHRQAMQLLLLLLLRSLRIWTWW